MKNNGDGGREREWLRENSDWKQTEKDSENCELKNENETQIFLSLVANSDLAQSTHTNTHHFPAIQIVTSHKCHLFDEFRRGNQILEYL